MVLPNGDTVALNSIHVRATEYSVGPNGLQAMPAELPPTNGYTYCVELSADEAIASGSKTVSFNKPVSIYVENFLGFPVGAKVPAGYYDREKGVWVPMDDGIIVGILSTDDGIAVVDVASSGEPADSIVLTALGFTTEELQSLASLYSSGQTLWRIQIQHFSPNDFNLATEIYDGNVGGDPQMYFDGIDESISDQIDCGSIIGIQHQLLKQRIPITGTPFNLYYNSEYSSRNISLNIFLTGDSLESDVKNLKSLRVLVEVAGIIYDTTIVPDSYLIHKWTWDRRDAYGRIVNGRIPCKISVGYTFDEYYFYYKYARWSPDQILQAGIKPRSFENNNEVLTISDVPVRTYTWWEYSSNLYISSFSSVNEGLGLWSFDVHHVYSPQSEDLYLGDGSKRNARAMSPIISTIAGNGNSDFTGDNGPANQASMNFAGGIALSPDGSIYIADTYNARIRRITPNGIITTVAGNGNSNGGGIISAFVANTPNVNTPIINALIANIPLAASIEDITDDDTYELGDGGPALEATISCPTGVAVGPDGSLYIADSYENRIRRVGPDSIITTIAGTGEEGFSGDGGPATQAQLSLPTQVIVGPDGCVYISNDGNKRIRKITPDGYISTIAGTGEAGYSGDGGTATLAKINIENAGMAIGPDGSLYFADTHNGRIRRVRPDGIITTVAGNGDFASYGDGGPAIDAAIEQPKGIAVTRDGTLYIADYWYSVIRKVDPSGIITTISGTGEWTYTGDAGPARRASFGEVDYLVVSPDGSLYMSDAWMSVVRKINLPFPGFSMSDIRIASEDAQEIYAFDQYGKHLRTEDALTGKTKWSFGYNNNGKLITITDIDSQITRIERTIDGIPTTIISPYDQRTLLQIDSTESLVRVTNPAGEATKFAYTPDGLMTTMIDPKENTHLFSYDSLGRLVLDVDPAGGFKRLDRTNITRGYEVEVSTALGTKNKYRVERLPIGDAVRTNINDAGLTTTTVIGMDATIKTTYPDGTVVTVVNQPDPRFGMEAPLSTDTTRLPSGLISTVDQKRVITQMTGLTVTGLTDSLIVNGRPYISIWDGEQKKFTSISPEGRQSYSWLDEKGRTIKDSIPSIQATHYNYDPQGRLVTVSQAGRTASYTYDAKSFLATATKPMQRVSRFEYDSVGRITRRILPALDSIGANNREILYSYDANGNLTSLTPPGKPIHSFIYSKLDFTEKYIPPILGMDTTETCYEYNKDKQISKVIRPDGGVIETIYDSVGCSACGSPASRPKTILFDRGALNFKYSSFTGNLDSLIAPAETLSYTYNGFLLTNITWSGEVNGNVGVTYDVNYRVTSQSINGGSTVNYLYDNDGLLTQAGSLSVTREPATGRISGTTLGNVTTSQSYDNLGMLADYKANYNGNPIFQTNYQRDSLGRITTLTETIQGQTKVMRYGYDIAGRLEKVWRHDTLISTYSNDANGNRIAHVTPISADSGMYDAQDRMLIYGNAQYIYSKNGELQKKIVCTDTTHYIYDYLGNLRNVVMPNGDNIEYIIDAQNRRIGKELNGVIVKRWIYSGQLIPIAELDSTGNVVSRFVGDYLIKNGSIYRLITDQGSIRSVINVITGEIVQQIDYDEFGNITYDSNPDFQPFGYAGGFYDNHTKLTRFYARDYDAKTGRWTTRDPIGFAGGQSNHFVYVDGDPINYFDPSGLGEKDKHRHAKQGALIGAQIGLAATLAVSIVLDAATGGANIVATPGELALGASGGAILGGFIGAIVDVIDDSQPPPAHPASSNDEENIVDDPAPPVSGNEIVDIVDDPTITNPNCEAEHRKVTPSKRNKHEEGKARQNQKKY